MNNIAESKMNFNELEEKIFKIVCNIGCLILKTILETQDKLLSHNRDKKKYRYKKRALTSIKTKMGVVEYYHTVYYDTEKAVEKNTKRTISLLAEFLNIKKYGQVSMNVATMIITAICKLSYRKVSETITDLTNLDISAMGVWNIVQEYGSQIREVEDNLIKEYLREAIECGSKEISILYTEADGVNINLQGKDKRKAIERFKNKYPDKEVPKRIKKEIKVAIMYEGIGSQSKRNKLVEKEVFAGVMTVNRLKNLINTFKQIKYGEVKVRLLNADGALWTNSISEKGTIRQLDEYHILDKINTKVCIKEDRRELRNLYYQEKFSEMILRVESLKEEYSYEEVECTKLDELKQYLESNINYLKRANKTEEVKKQLNEDEKILSMGYQESNNFSCITQRMKRQRMSFSTSGADNLTAILSTYKSERKKTILNAINTSKLPIKLVETADEYIEKLEENIQKYKIKVANQKEVHTLPSAEIFNKGLYSKEIEQQLKAIILA